MIVEVLLATMNQTDDSVLEKMKIQSNVLVCNQQQSVCSYEKYEKNGHVVRWYNFQEKGVGLNRNNALLRSDADICVLADDDIVYKDNYEKTLIEAYKKYPHADVILFNVENHGYKVKKIKRINRLNCGRFGGVRISFRRLSVIKNAISFNQLFGGGCVFAAGEDNMFIRDCIRKGLKVYAIPQVLLSLTNERESTWFKGYDDKFFEDLGSSYCYHYNKLAGPMAIIQLFIHRKRYLSGRNLFRNIKCIYKGINIYRKM